MNINREWYEDKVRACWVGKNIGGTMGGPFEGKREMQNVTGFTTEKGKALPNDDLDLQLVWLKAIEERGILNITSPLLGEYWISCIPPHWNEYGLAKTNLKMGLLPPYSGEYENQRWKHSNGAWIRTEIWACLFPGFPEIAVKYSYKDACVDHGLGEGTYAAMFVAALESAAFLENDLRKLIETGLSFIPCDCMTANSIKLAIDCYDNGVDFAEARNRIVKQNESIGMFQAPSNVAFVVLGLLYGEGDFKKTMIHTINCGDDTDCTASTVGSIMAIMNGSAAIPSDWQEYIGDGIVTCSVDPCVMRKMPRSCEELTQRVVSLMPITLGALGIAVNYTDGEYERGPKEKDRYIGHMSIPTNPYTYDEIADLGYMKARVEFDKDPLLKPHDTIKLTATFKTMTTYEPQTLSLKLHLPEGWSAEYQKNKRLTCEDTAGPNPEQYWSAQITAGENVDMINKIYLEVKAEGRIMTGMIPIVILG